MTLDHIVEETRQLPPDIVAELVERILVARHGGLDPAVEQQWKEEVRQRINQIQNGGVEGIPVDESLARMRQLAGL